MVNGEDTATTDPASAGVQTNVESLLQLPLEEQKRRVKAVNNRLNSLMGQFEQPDSQ